MIGDRIVVIGAGAGGLAAAAALSAQGFAVTVLERADAVGGKMRQVSPADRPMDAGPTVFTMRWVFDALFDSAGARLEDHMTIRPATTLARHAWDDGAPFDLFADIDRAADEVGRRFDAREAAGFRAFCAEGAAMFATLKAPFLAASRPDPFTLAARVGISGLAALAATRPFETLWSALGQHFADPRLRQLFGRYATYCGSSPFRAPATLMLIAHVEQDGVWLVDGGMHAVAQGVAELARKNGATIRTGVEVARIETSSAGVSGVILTSGERIACDAAVFAGDAAALPAGLLGPEVAGAAPAPPDHLRSLSAITWCLDAPTDGFELLRHTVFFSPDYPAEFDALHAGRLPDEPTVYVCAQDRGDEPAPRTGPERLLVLVNAPPRGDDLQPTDIETCERRTFRHLERCGLKIDRQAGQAIRTAPGDFDRLFPGSRGAIYGRASHGWASSFTRPGSKSAVPGLWLAGGGVHPGAGVPMATLSGMLCAQAIAKARASTRRYRPAATPGGISTPSATTAPTA